MFCLTAGRGRLKSVQRLSLGGIWGCPPCPPGLAWGEGEQEAGALPWELETWGELSGGLLKLSFFKKSLVYPHMFSEIWK